MNIMGATSSAAGDLWAPFCLCACMLILPHPSKHSIWSLLRGAFASAPGEIAVYHDVQANQDKPEHKLNLPSQLCRIDNWNDVMLDKALRVVTEAARAAQ